MAYFRRIIDNTWKDLIDSIIGITSDDKIIKSLESVKKVWEFEKQNKIVKPHIPNSILINNENPLKLLYDALSRGLRALPKSECLKIARNVRLVFERTLQNIAHFKEETRDLKQAVSALKK